VLQLHTVQSDTLELLKVLMKIPELGDFNLAGGTSMALQVGHRMSYDLDFFGNRPFTPEEITDLVYPVGDIEIAHKTRNILTININGIKVDFVNYRYPLLKPIKILMEIRLVDLSDIAAMKISAVTGRGRKRDFIDLYFLLQKYSFVEIMDFYNQKYSDGNEWLVARSITYFDDAESDADTKLFKNADWKTVKKTISNEALKYFK